MITSLSSFSAILPWEVRVTRKVILALVSSTTIALPMGAQTRPDSLRRYVSVDAPVVALTHVRVIDGTGRAPQEDQTIVIEKGRIRSIGPATQAQVPPGAQVL